MWLSRKHTIQCEDVVMFEAGVDANTTNQRMTANLVTGGQSEDVWSISLEVSQKEVFLNSDID